MKGRKLSLLLVIILTVFLFCSCGSKDKSADIKPIDFSQMEVTKENVSSALAYYFGKNEIKNIDITETNGEYTIGILYSPSTVSDEKFLVRETAYYGAKAMNVLFQNEKISKVAFSTQAQILDSKGNATDETVVSATLTKETAKDINWGNFIGMVDKDYNALFNIAEDVYIAPVIAEKL